MHIQCPAILLISGLLTDNDNELQVNGCLCTMTDEELL